MILVRRPLIALAALAMSFALVVPDAAAARHHVCHTAAHHVHRPTQVVTAIYQMAARPHASHRLRAARTNGGHFAQGFDRSLTLGS